jgi:hypothetical protein
MIQAGYMAKIVHSRPEWLEVESVVDIYSVSHCVSHDFADYIQYWKHNGYWFFDSPEVICQLAKTHSIELVGAKLFFYEVYELEFHSENSRWLPFKAESSFETNVIEPSAKQLEGFDVVNFSAGTSPECSPLSCNSLAIDVGTNKHCLLTSFDRARILLEQGKFTKSEPGPYRIFAVYSVRWL